MAKLTLSNVANISGAESAAIGVINANSDAIEAALENTLSRDGSTPNTMGADLDMNNNDLINVGELNVDSLSINGVPIDVDFSGLADIGDAIAETAAMVADAEAAKADAEAAAEVVAAATIGAISPENFGAVADCVVLYDGEMVSGTAFLDSATATFTAGDVGKVICVEEGLDLSGDPLKPWGSLLTTIKSFVSATRVELNAACDKTVTGATFGYGTSDAASFDAMIVAAKASKGANIRLTPGKTYLLNATITVDEADNVKITGGGAKIFHAQAGHSPNHFSLYGTDGFEANGIVFESTYNGYKWGSQGEASPIYFGSAVGKQNRNALVQNCTFKMFAHSGVVLAGRLYDGTDGANKNIRILNNNFKFGAVPVFVYSNADDVRIENNSAEFCNYLIVADTRAQSDANTDYRQISRVSLTGNRARTIGGTDSNLVSNGILFKGGITDAVISDNHVKDIEDSTVSSVGIVLSPDWGLQTGKNIRITGNTIDGITPTTGAGLPLQITGPWENVLVDGNDFIDCDRGVQLPAEGQVTFARNTFRRVAKTVGTAQLDVLVPSAWPGTLVSGDVPRGRVVSDGDEFYRAIDQHTPGASLAADAAHWELIYWNFIKINGNAFFKTDSLASTAVLLGAGAKRVSIDAQNTFEAGFTFNYNTNSNAVAFEEVVVAQGSFAYAGASVGAGAVTTIGTVTDASIKATDHIEVRQSTSGVFRETIIHAQASTGSISITAYNAYSVSKTLPAATVYWRAKRALG